MTIFNDLLTGNRGTDARVFLLSLHLNWHATEICMPLSIF